MALPPARPAGPMQPAMMMFSSKYWARRGFSLDSALPEERPAVGSLTVSGGAGSGASPPGPPPAAAAAAGTPRGQGRELPGQGSGERGRVQPARTEAPVTLPLTFSAR